MRISYLILACAVVLGSASSVYAKSADERLSELEKRLSAIQQTYLVNNAEIASSLARSQAIQQEFAGLKGTVEANNHLISSQRQDLMRMLQDLEHRLQSIEERMEIFSVQINQAIGKVSPQAAGEGQLYQGALTKANNGDYLGAINDFQSFIKKYPKSTFAPNAQYWIGECYFSMKNFKRSIKEFQSFIESNPRHEKVPAAIYQQGSSFYELGMLDESKPFFEKIIKDYPTSAEASRAQSKLEMVAQRKAGAPAAVTQPVGPATSYPTETIQQQKEKYRQQVQTGPQSQAPSTQQNQTANRHYTEF